MHKNSLANLKPPWQPGESGSPGRKSAGAYISEWINELAIRTREHVDAVLADESANVAKRIAAARVLRAMRLDAEGDRATELVCDRTAGRPVQAVVNITADVADLFVFDSERGFVILGIHASTVDLARISRFFAKNLRFQQKKPRCSR